ncbi:MAG: hypothetical protein ACYTGG_08920 [Planctomycetota bacterium]|jgi:hypothetical protein
MGVRPFNLLVLLAIGVAVAAFRPGWAVLHSHGLGDRHVHDDHAGHHHEHDHGPLRHAHAHHHHPGEPHEEDPDHHGGDVDDRREMPKTRWVAPRRIEIDAPPSPPMHPAVTAPMPSDWLPLRRAKPPPAASIHAQRLMPLRTVILRL